jgi:hypothetical protein
VVSIKHKQMTLWGLLAALLLLGGCSASNHPMTQMIRAQREIMQDLADILHGVEDISDLEPAMHQMEDLTEQMKRRMTQITKNMGKNSVPTSRAQAKRLQSAMQREMKKYKPIVKQIQSEMTRLAKLDWSKPLLEAANQAKFEYNMKPQ